MQVPLIGLTTNSENTPDGYQRFTLGEAYTRAVSQAGGVPILIPLGLPVGRLRTIVDRLDGILFTGGGDVRPQVYGSQDHPRVHSIDDDRDRVELDLFHWLEQSGKPFLGICRGIQMINVALGGTLYEDIEDQKPGSLKHDCHGLERNHLAHSVKVVEDSRLGQILSLTETQVNSLHHQAVRGLAKGVTPTAWSPDGLVEAFEVPGNTFGVAVQWHPEWLQEHQPMRDLFRAFVQAAVERS